MRPDPSSVVCERVRMQVSLELDDELSALEKRMLDTHLSRCAICRAYAEDVNAFTTRLRAAPLERMLRPVIVTRSRRMLLDRAPIALAAAIVVASAASVLQLAVPGARPTSSAITQLPTLREGVQESRQVVIDGRAFKRHRGSLYVF